jgi:hypothetical protein
MRDLGDGDAGREQLGAADDAERPASDPRQRSLHRGRLVRPCHH